MHHLAATSLLMVQFCGRLNPWTSCGSELVGCVELHDPTAVPGRHDHLPHEHSNTWTGVKRAIVKGHVNRQKPACIPIQSATLGSACFPPHVQFLAAGGVIMENVSFKSAEVMQVSHSGTVQPKPWSRCYAL
jgi:hypothetical protein